MQTYYFHGYHIDIDLENKVRVFRWDAAQKANYVWKTIQFDPDQTLEEIQAFIDGMVWGTKMNEKSIESEVLIEEEMINETNEL